MLPRGEGHADPASASAPADRRSHEEQLRGEVQELRCEVAERDQRLERLLRKHADAVPGQTDREPVLNHLLQELQVDFEGLQKYSIELQAEVWERDDLLNFQEAKLASLKDNASGLDRAASGSGLAAGAGTSAGAGAADADADTTSKCLAQLEAELLAREARLGELQMVAAVQKTRLAEVEHKLSARTAQLEEVRSRSASDLCTADAAAGGASERDGTAAELKATLASHVARAAVSKRDLANRDARVTELQEVIARTGERIAALTADVSTAQQLAAGAAGEAKGAAAAAAV